MSRWEPICHWVFARSIYCRVISLTSSLEGEVQVVEQLGNETQIHIQIPSIRQNLVYRQNDVVLVEEGATFAIGLPPERCHLFREDGTACRRLHKEPGV